jgi:hypothetical protein
MELKQGSNQQGFSVNNTAFIRSDAARVCLMMMGIRGRADRGPSPVRKGIGYDAMPWWVVCVRGSPDSAGACLALGPAYPAPSPALAPATASAAQPGNVISERDAGP